MLEHQMSQNGSSIRHRRFGRREKASPAPVSTAITVIDAPKRRSGAQPGNRNRLIHGHFSTNPDLYCAPQVAPSLPVLIAQPRDEDLALMLSFLQWKKRDGKSDNTLRHYRYDVRSFLSFLVERGTPLAEADQVTVWEWFEDMKAQGLESATRRGRALGLFQFYKWWLEEDDCPLAGVGDRRHRNPFSFPRKLALPELEDKRKAVVPPEAFDQVLTRLELDHNWRDAAILSILLDTGMREEELASSETVNWFPKSGQIVLPGSITKNKEGRTVHLEERAQLNLARYLRQKRKAPEFLITGRKGHMHGNGIYQVVAKHFLPWGKFGPHAFRHSMATYAALLGATVAELQLLGGWKDSGQAKRYARGAGTYQALQAHKSFSPLANLGKLKELYKELN